jgi:hypothetical protein
MKLLFFLILTVLVLESCGKKSDPKYQVKINHELKFVS